MDVRTIKLADLIGLGGAAPQGAALQGDMGIERVDQLVGTGHYTRQPPALVLGELEPHAEIYRVFVQATKQPCLPICMVTFRNASVLSQGAVITSDGRLIAESCTPFIRDRVPMFGLEPVDAETFRRTTGSSRHVETPALLIKVPWWRNYGHWLVDQASLLALAHSCSSLPLDTTIVVGAHEDAAMREVMQETIESINPRYDIVEHPDEECWTFSCLHYVTPIHLPPLFKSPQALSALRERLLPVAAPEKPQGRFYIQRPPTGRGLTNEPEVIELCRAYGLQSVQPETMTLRQQINLFRHAELIVGVKGAAFTNMVFCAPGASAILLSPADFSDAFYWDIAAQMQLSYIEVFGELASRDRRTGQNSFTIDMEHLDHALRTACPQTSFVQGIYPPTRVPMTPKDDAIEPQETRPITGLETAELLVHVQNVGDVRGGFDAWVGTPGSRRWIEGFCITLPEGVAPEEIECMAVFDRTWSSPWMPSGSFVAAAA